MNCKWQLKIKCNEKEYEESGEGNPGELIQAVEELLETTLTLVDNELEEGETYEYPT
ncbi:MAG: hypothetical protein HXS54_06270 [Theionarchaea archaeon]|nr:hypothetical protein [Theionarchaea archaeon]DBA34864.1 TPA_asm: hypothetical protein vir521_00070 [Caudoviricetes sp. vir521]